MESPYPARGKRRRASAWARRLASLFIAVLSNVSLIAVAELGLRPPPRLSASPPIQLELLPPVVARSRDVRRRPPAQSKPPSVATAAIEPRPSPPTAPAEALPPTPADKLEQTDALRAVLRATLGCTEADMAQLTSAERERCRARLAAVKGGPSLGPLAHIDASKLAAFDAPPRPTSRS